MKEIIKNIFDENIELKEKTNQERQQIIIKLLNQLKEKEQNNGTN